MNLVRSVFKFLGAHKILSFLLFALVLAIAGGTRFYLSRSERIKTVKVRNGTILESVYGIGTVTANKRFQIKVGVVGHIDQTYVKEGDSVLKGSSLINVDGLIWRAPFSGTITYFPYKLGEMAFPETPLLVLVDMRDRYLLVSLEQQGALRVRPGQNVHLSFDSLREETYSGVVKSVYSNDINFLARIDIGNLPDRVLPGMTADVAIVLQSKDKVLLVPVEAIDQGKLWITRRKKYPEAIPVKIGLVDKEMAEVSSDRIQDGDEVLVKGKPTP